MRNWKPLFKGAWNKSSWFALQLSDERVIIFLPSFLPARSQRIFQTISIWSVSVEAVVRVSKRTCVRSEVTDVGPQKGPHSQSLFHFTPEVFSSNPVTTDIAVGQSHWNKMATPKQFQHCWRHTIAENVEGGKESSSSIPPCKGHFSHSKKKKKMVPEQFQ